MRAPGFLSLVLTLGLVASSVSRAVDKDPPGAGETTWIQELPELVRSAKAVYPELAREAGVEGTVVVGVLVGTTCRVEDAKIYKSIPMLDQAALDAARKYVFKPYLEDGKPTAVWVALPITFRFLEAGGPPVDTLVGPARPLPGHSTSPALSDLLAALRARGVHPPSENDALLRERIIRTVLAMKQRPELPAEAVERFDRARRAMQGKLPPTEVLPELASVLHEAPWWSAPYREIARIQEQLRHWEDAIVSLELYLVAAPEATDWERVRFELRRLRGKLGESQ